MILRSVCICTGSILFTLGMCVVSANVVLCFVRAEATYCSLRCVSLSRSWRYVFCTGTMHHSGGRALLPLRHDKPQHTLHYQTARHHFLYTNTNTNMLSRNTTPSPHITSTPYWLNIDTSLSPHCTFSHPLQPIHQKSQNTDANYTNHTDTKMRGTWRRCIPVLASYKFYGHAQPHLKLIY